MVTTARLVLRQKVKHKISQFISLMRGFYWDINHSYNDMPLTHIPLPTPILIDCKCPSFPSCDCVPSMEAQAAQRTCLTSRPVLRAAYTSALGTRHRTEKVGLLAVSHTDNRSVQHAGWKIGWLGHRDGRLWTALHRYRADIQSQGWSGLSVCVKQPGCLCAQG